MPRPMMSLVALAVASLLLVPGLASAYGFQKGEFEVSPTLGVSLPLGGDLSDVTDPGFAIGAQGLYFLSPRAGIGAAIIYNALGSEVDGYDFSITEFHAIGKLFFPTGGNLDLYGKGALGLFNNSVSVDEAFGFGGSSSEFGFGLGGGIQSRAGESWGWFGEAMFMFDDFDDIYLGLRAGANFYFGGPAS